MILNSSAKGAAFTAVNTVWLGLCSSIGSEGLTYMEPPAASAYARQLIVFGSAPSNRRLTNTNSFAYPAASAAWPAIPHLALFSSATSVANDMVVYGTLSSTKTIITSVIGYVAIGSISFRVD